MAERMRAPLGQSVVVETVGGAGGSIGVGRVARAAPDGYTIDIGQWDTHVGNIIYPINYDLQKDFEPIGLMSINPQLMIARKDFPAGDLKGLVAWMRANPGKATLVEQTAAAKLSGIVMQQATRTTLLFIPFRGAGPPKQVVARLNAAMVEALADPALKARFSDLGLDVASRELQTPEGLAAFHQAEIEKWWPIIKAAGIKVE